jgi:hypothetical protein
MTCAVLARRYARRLDAAAVVGDEDVAPAD